MPPKTKPSHAGRRQGSPRPGRRPATPSAQHSPAPSAQGASPSATPKPAQAGNHAAPRPSGRTAPRGPAAAGRAAPNAAPPASGEPIRLNKALAAAGVCSRRRADELIMAGAVRVNGAVVDTPGVKVVPGQDAIEVEGRAVELAPPASRKHEYILLHKPIRTVTTMSDPQGRPTVLDLLPQALRDARVTPVGRLDFYSEGLLLLTTDGDLLHRLTHPSHHLSKIYLVRARGLVSDEVLDIMRSGMTLAEGDRLAPVDVRVVRRFDDGAMLEMTLVQGVNRQIRRMCRDLDLTILTLRRMRHGPIDLRGMACGAWRRLTPDEVAALYKAVGLKEPCA
ncbi:MAG: pseudouridine synthase [Desulfovibrionaceae bacterium]